MRTDVVVAETTRRLRGALEEFAHGAIRRIDVSASTQSSSQPGLPAPGDRGADALQPDAPSEACGGARPAKQKAPISLSKQAEPGAQAPSLEQGGAHANER